MAPFPYSSEFAPSESQRPRGPREIRAQPGLAKKDNSFFLKKKKIVERENEIKTKGGNWPPDGEKRDGSLKTQRKAALYLLVHLIPNGATTQFTSSSKSYIVSIVLP